MQLATCRTQQVDEVDPSALRDEGGRKPTRRAEDASGMTNGLRDPRTLGRALVAGIIGGITILACIAVGDATLLRTPGFSLDRFFAFNASTLVGSVAYTAGSYVALGAALHFAVAIGWAIGYSVAAQGQPQLLRRPLLSGAMFGVIVYFAMQLVIVGANLYRIPTPAQLGVALLAHIVFYGMPVALIVARFARAT